MAITRTPMIDDDGSGTTGTIINNAWKQELYGQIDALFGALGTWTPVDLSGAGLVLGVSGAAYCKIGHVVTIAAYITYPATTNGAMATIGGLPFIVTGSYHGFAPGGGSGRIYHTPPNAQQFIPCDGVTGLTQTNAQLSGAVLMFSGSYLTTS